MNIKEKLWSKIKQIRKEKKILQEELAIKTDLHRSYISAIEWWNKNVSIENIEKIALWLGVEVKDLFK